MICSLRYNLAMNVEQRPRRDARLVAGDSESAAHFECLATQVFDPALDATFMGRVCGALPGSLS